MERNIKQGARATRSAGTHLIKLLLDLLQLFRVQIRKLHLLLCHVGLSMENVIDLSSFRP